ncbi:MAG TPA: DUF2442 domain-containing protein [Longimicrobium sp.]|nr:DUF2442 domain-containing protein [Longimicrobium sp.]
MARKNGPTDEEILAQLPAAAEQGKMEPVAERVFYDTQSGYFFVHCRFAFRPDQVKGLEGATLDQLASCELLGSGESIYWPELDEGASVADLAAGAFGDAPWVRQFAARGGRAKSAVKAAAVRENGKKGGRPAKKRSASVEEVETDIEPHITEDRNRIQRRATRRQASG